MFDNSQVYSRFVLVWINGPFGGGKTQTAHELHRRLPGSVICDPELVGFGLHRMMPPELRHDFQDIPAWRQGVFEVLHHTLLNDNRVVIAPMTLVERSYFDQIIGRLRTEGHTVHHFALLADRDTVLRRLRERGVGHLVNRVVNRRRGGRESFAVTNLDRCLERLHEPHFAAQVNTDQLTVPAVAEHIAAVAGLDLLPNHDSPARQRLRQAWIGLRHIRFD